MRQLGKLSLVALALCAIVPASAGAATINVTTTADGIVDDQLCSLREAVQAANTNAPVFVDDCPPGDDSTSLDTIQLGSATYRLTEAGVDDTNAGGDLDALAGGPLLIRGTGPASSVIDAMDNDRAVDSLSTPLALERLKVQNGTADSDRGGGVRAQSATLSLTEVTVANSDAATDGGGVAAGAALTIARSTVIANAAPGEGGGVYAAASATITDSAIRANEASIGGGLRLAGAGGSSLVRSAVLSNRALGSPAVGGGIHIAPTADLELRQSAVTHNTAISSAPGDTTGGGIHNAGGDLTLRDSSVTSNAVASAAGADQLGGGIYSGPTGGILTLVNTTVSGNSAGPSASAGGGIHVDDTALTLLFSTVADNNAADGAALDRDGAAAATITGSILHAGDPSNVCSGTFVSGGYNVDAGTSCGLANPDEDVQDADPQLRPLARYGGPAVGPPGSATALNVHSIPTSSPAVDLMPQLACLAALAPLTTDQRAFARPAPPAGSCDAGAYELTGNCRGEGLTQPVGGPAGETIAGTTGPDVIDGGGGADTISGDSGDDVICGGDGNDTLEGGPGRDFLDGGPGKDRLTYANSDGGISADLAAGTVFGGESNDRVLSFEVVTATVFTDILRGTEGAETLISLDGNDGILLLGGNDVARGGRGSDQIRGGGGDDTLIGNGESDRLVGGDGDDRLVGNRGNRDRLLGGPGRDWLNGGPGKADRLLGGPGRDWLNGGPGKKDRCNGGPGRDRAKRGCERRWRIP